MNQRETFVTISVYRLKRAFREAHASVAAVEAETQWAKFWSRIMVVPKTAPPNVDSGGSARPEEEPPLPLGDPD